MEILQKFINQKVDIDCVDGQNRTPFIWAASTGYLVDKQFHEEEEEEERIFVLQEQPMLYVCCTNMERINYMQIKIV